MQFNPPVWAFEIYGQHLFRSVNELSMTRSHRRPNKAKNDCAQVKAVDSASQIPNDSAQFSPCSLLIGFPCEGQEIDCRLGA